MSKNSTGNETKFGTPSTWAATSRIHEPIVFWKPGAVSELPVSARATNKTPKPEKRTAPVSLARPMRFSCAPRCNVIFGSLTRCFALP